MSEVPVLNRRASKSASGKELISIGKSVAKRTKNRLQLFFVAATRARERHKHNLIEVVMAAAHKDARHAEWLLERQFPHEFAPYDRRPLPSEETPSRPSLAITCTEDGALDRIFAQGKKIVEALDRLPLGAKINPSTGEISTSEPEPKTADHGMKSRLNPFNGKLEWVSDDEPNDDHNV